MDKKFGFTLAEVLITLGIIGVIAALTIPTLMTNYRKHVVETKLEKIYSVMNQAINLANAEYGDASNWVIDCGKSGSATCSNEDVETWFNSTIGKHLEISKIEKPSDFDGILIFLNDGGVLYIEKCIYDMKYFLKQSAIQNPQLGKDTFQFRFNPTILSHQDPTKPSFAHTFKTTFEPYAWDWDGTREQLINGKNYSCGGKYHSYCAKLIQYDGWKISKDYPVRI